MTIKSLIDCDYEIEVELNETDAGWVLKLHISSGTNTNTVTMTSAGSTSPLPSWVSAERVQSWDAIIYGSMIAEVHHWVVAESWQ